MFCAPHFPNWKITVPFSMLYVSRKKTKTQKKKVTTKNLRRIGAIIHHQITHIAIIKSPRSHNSNHNSFYIICLFEHFFAVSVCLTTHTHTHNRTLCCITFTGTTIICPVIRSYYLTYYL
jgi:hypothetical protein